MRKLTLFLFCLHRVVPNTHSGWFSSNSQRGSNNLLTGEKMKSILRLSFLMLVGMLIFQIPEAKAQNEKYLCHYSELSGKQEQYCQETVIKQLESRCD